MSITVNNCSGHNATAEDILILADTPSFKRNSVPPQTLQNIQTNKKFLRERR